MPMLLAFSAALAFTTGGVFMKYADGVERPGPVAGFVVLFAVGAALQSLAMRGEELGVVYILVLGLEAALAFGLGILLFDEAASARKVAAVALIVGGIALLRWT
jgi:multidrug transporter EmrE-like cation transporter